MKKLFGIIAAAVLMSFWLAPGAPALAKDSSDDLVVFGGDQTVKEGQVVHGDLVVLGGNADVYGQVEGDAVCIGGHIYIAPQGAVLGSLVSLGGSIDNESTTAPHARRASPTPMPEPTEQPEVAPATPVPVPMHVHRHMGSSFWQHWTSFIVMDALFVLLAFLLFPLRTRSTIDHLIEYPLMAAVVGFFSPVIFVLMAVALCITVIGIPLLPLLAIVAFLGYLVGKAALAAIIGDRLFQVAKAEPPKPVVGMLVGLLILVVISTTGWLGVVFYWVIMALALGAALYAMTRTAQIHRQARMAAAPGPPPPPAAAGFAPPVGPAPTGPPAVP
ncbi:MAG: hypothetical protein ACR2KS_03035 [Candidatus Eremiobacter antarcticus]|nr:hypothetical protein [Candidatus Eremiobacteraeota bacterium]